MTKRDKLFFEQLVEHPFQPWADRQSRLLILGSLPSVKSRAEGFYYAHPRNRFWPVVAAVFAESVPDSISAKQDFLSRHRIALWDVVKTGMIKGSRDSTLKALRINAVAQLIKETNIQYIFANGQTAAGLYHKYCYMQTGMKAILLPSTSPANARWDMAALIQAWQRIKM